MARAVGSMGMLFILAAKFVGRAIKEFNIMLDHYNQEFRYLPYITRPSSPLLFPPTQNSVPFLWLYYDIIICANIVILLMADHSKVAVASG